MNNSEELARLVPDPIRRFNLDQLTKWTFDFFRELPPEAKKQWENNCEWLIGEVRRKGIGDLERPFTIDGETYWVMTLTHEALTTAHVVSDAQREIMLQYDKEDSAEGNARN